jgi:signal transduction histidine kinase
MSREDAVDKLLRALVRAGFRGARYYELDGRVQRTDDVKGLEDLAVLVDQHAASGVEVDTWPGFSIPWNLTALHLVGDEKRLFVTDSDDFIIYYPEASHWYQLIHLAGLAWFDAPVLRNGNVIGLVAAEWEGQAADLSGDFRTLLSLLCYRIGGIGGVRPFAVRPLNVDSADPETLVLEATKQLINRLDATFGAVFKFDWRANHLTKEAEYFSCEGEVNEIDLKEPSYEAGRAYLTGRAWAERSYRYVSDFKSLVEAQPDWVETGSQIGHRKLMKNPIRTVLYGIVGTQERRYLLRFMNRSRDPDLPYLPDRRQVFDRLITPLGARVDSLISTQRVKSVSSITRATVLNIAQPAKVIPSISSALHAEGVTDFLYMAFSGGSQPGFSHRAGIFDNGSTPLEFDSLSQATTSESQPGIAARDIETIGAEHSLRIAQELKVALGERRLLVATAATGETTGYLLTPVHAGLRPRTIPGQSEILQSCTDILTTSVDATATYISADGARRALGYIGHEIGTPFAILGDAAIDVAISGMKSANSLSKDNPSAARSLERTARRAYHRIQRSRDEIDRVMEIAPVLASMGSGTIKMFFREHDLQKIVETAVSRIMTETRGVQATVLDGGYSRRRAPKFEVNLRESLAKLPRVVVDDALIQQAVINLIRNAVKYSLPRRPPAPMQIIISGQMINSQTCAVTVGNWGFGVSAEMQSKIFLPFVRAQLDDRMKALPGMGLGLYLVHTIVSAHRGTVHVRSTPTLDDPKRTANLEGFYTEFELRLPIGLPAGPGSALIDPRQVSAGASRGI